MENVLILTDKENKVLNQKAGEIELANKIFNVFKIASSIILPVTAFILPFYVFIFYSKIELFQKEISLSFSYEKDFLFTAISFFASYFSYKFSRNFIDFLKDVFVLKEDKMYKRKIYEITQNLYEKLFEKENFEKMELEFLVRQSFLLSGHFVEAEKLYDKKGFIIKTLTKNSKENINYNLSKRMFKSIIERLSILIASKDDYKAFFLLGLSMEDNKEFKDLNTELFKYLKEVNENFKINAGIDLQRIDRTFSHRLGYHEYENLQSSDYNFKNFPSTLADISSYMFWKENRYYVEQINYALTKAKAVLRKKREEDNKNYKEVIDEIFFKEFL